MTNDRAYSSDIDSMLSHLSVTHGSYSNLGYLLIMAARVWNKRLMNKFEEGGYDDLKPSYGAVFIPLFDKDNRTISEIIEFSQVSKQTMTVYIKELKKKRYIETKPDPEDPRFTRVFLSARGKVLKKVADRVVSEVNKDFLKDLGPNEIKMLMATLTRWIQKS